MIRPIASDVLRLLSNCFRTGTRITGWRSSSQETRSGACSSSSNIIDTGLTRMSSLSRNGRQASTGWRLWLTFGGTAKVSLITRCCQATQPSLQESTCTVSSWIELPPKSMKSAQITSKFNSVASLLTGPYHCRCLNSKIVWNTKERDVPRAPINSYERKTNKMMNTYWDCMPQQWRTRLLEISETQYIFKKKIKQPRMPRFSTKLDMLHK